MFFYTLKPRFKEKLDRFGLAVDHFPNYISDDAGLHGLDLILFTFIVQGKGKHLLNNSSFDVHGGSVGITYFDEVHAVETDEAGMEIYNIFLDPEHFQMPSLSKPLNDVLHVILPQERGFRNILNRSIHLDLPNAKNLAGVIGHLMEELNSESPSFQVVNNCIALFLTECCRAAMRTGIRSAISGDAKPPGWVDKIHQHLDNHYRENIELDDLAKLVRMSRGYICRAFKQHCGQSIFDYLIERRIQAAMLQLRTTNDQVLNIAMNSGFNDLSHFNRTFKQRVGCSPLQYRKKHLPS